MKDFPSGAGPRIRTRREALGFTQAALAEAAGISGSYLNLIEHGRRRIGGKLLARLADLLDTDLITLSEGAEAGLLAALEAAAATPLGQGAETARLDELTHRFPGWSATIARLQRRLAELERQNASLSDRLRHDPELARALHEILSTATAIRTTAAILAETPDLAPEWQARFQRNVNEEATRLAQSGQAMVRYLDRIETSATPDTLEGWLAARDWALPEIEPGGAGRAALLRAMGEIGARARAQSWIERVRADARRLGLPELRRALAETPLSDPLELARRLAIPPELILRRAACLGDQPLGFALLSGEGAVLLHRPLEGGVPESALPAHLLRPALAAATHPGALQRLSLESDGLLPRPLVALALAVQDGPPPAYDRAPPLLIHVLVMDQRSSSTHTGT